MSIRFCYCLLAALAITGIARAEAVDALDDVNAARAQHGLRPFVKCPQLTAGAVNAAQFRAARLIVGHTANDFAALPPGTTADAAGCAAWPVHLGWGSCATFEPYTYAGAAWAMGSNGQRFMHLFVRGPQSQGVPNALSRYPVSSVRGRRR